MRTFLSSHKRAVFIGRFILGLILVWTTPPALAESPTPLQLYSYNFDDGTTDWKLDSSWSWVPSEGGHAIRGTGHGFASLTAHSGDVSLLRFRFRLEGIKSNFHANVRESWPNGTYTRYAVRFQTSGVVISKFPGPNPELGKGFAPIAPNVFHEVQIMVGSGSIDVFVDGEAIVGVDDSSPPPDGSISFESLQGTEDVDDVTVQIGPEPAPHPRAPRPPLSLPPGPNVGPFVNGVYTGTFTLGASTVLTLTTGLYTVKEGDINISGTARLHILPDAVLAFDRGTSPLIHKGINLDQEGVLQLEGGNIVATGGTLVRIDASSASQVIIHGAKPWIHFINAHQHARVSMIGSRFVTDLGGSIQLSEQATVNIQESRVGAIALFMRQGSQFVANDLAPEVYSSFDLHNDPRIPVINGVDFNLQMTDVELVPDTMGEGPYERGWVLFADENATVQINNSILRKMVYTLPWPGPGYSLNSLKLNQPTSLTIGNVVINNVTVTGQWGFDVKGWRHMTFNDSDALWFFLYDNAGILLRNSTMNEFDPRNYVGTVGFENGAWKTAGEIIGNNKMAITGTLTMDDDVRQTLSWSQSTVTRTYPVSVLDLGGSPVAGAVITLTKGANTVTAVTNGAGQASVSLTFTDSDYKQPWQLTSSASRFPMTVDFYSTTPITVREYRVNLPLVFR